MVANTTGKSLRWLWAGLKFAGAMAIVGGLVYWFRFSPILVVEHTIQRGSIQAEVMGTGTLEARVEGSIGPKISGRIEQVLADEGDRVSQGQVLVQLDDQELKQQVAIAQANVEASEAAIARLKADKDRATAVFTQAQKSHERVEALATRNAISQDELDSSTEALAVAVTGVSRAEAAIVEGEKELIAAKKNLEFHQTLLDDSSIKCPFDGLIVSRNREPGDVVVPGSSILKLISTNQLWISAWVDETEMARLEPGQLAHIVFRSEAEESYPGKVVRLAKETDRETREFVVDIDVIQLPDNWAVGQRAEAYIDVARKDGVVLLPSELLLNQAGQTGVFVNDGGQAAWRPLTTGLRGKDTVEVLEGLSPGDTVVSPVLEGVTLTIGRRVLPQ